MEYHLRWEIDLEADSPEAAAAEALAIQRGMDAACCVFDITDDNGHSWQIDALDGNETEE